MLPNKLSPCFAKLLMSIIITPFHFFPEHSEQLIEDNLTEEDADRFISDEFNKKRMRRLAYKTAPPDHKFGLDWR